MKPLINLSHLKFFCDAVIYSSVSEAAKINYVSQSAVSQAIAKLEMILSVSLVIHSRQKFQITDEGKILFEQARHIFKAVDNIHEKINQNKEEITGSVKFVTTKSLSMSFIAPLYKEMQNKFPQVNIHFRSGGLNFIRNALRQGEAEFALVVYDQDFSQFSKHPLKKGRFNLYQNHEAPHYQIENGILVDFFEGTHVNDLVNYFSQINRPQLRIQAELSGWEIVARFAEMNVGIGFFPDYLVSNNRFPTLKVHPLEIPSFEYEICAIHKKGEKLSRAACAFLDQFLQNETGQK